MVLDSQRSDLFPLVKRLKYFLSAIYLVMRTLRLKIGEPIDQDIDTIEEWVSQGRTVILIGEDDSGNEICRTEIPGGRSKTPKS